MNPQSLAHAFAITVACAGTVVSARAVSFSAELLDTVDGVTHTGSFQYQEKSYRFETVENGQPSIVTCTEPEGTTRLVIPGEKSYYEVGRDHPLALMGSPFAFYAHYLRKYGAEAQGADLIDGISCTKQVVAHMGQLFVIAWWSEELGFPMKVETPPTGRTVELRKIKRGAQGDVRFVVPPDYTLLPDPTAPRIPDWVRGVADAPFVSPPCETTLVAGGITRIRPQAGKPITLKLKNPGSEPGVFTAVGFKDGKPRNDPSMSTATLNPDDEVSMTFSQGPTEIDEIVIRCGSGTVQFKAEFAGDSG